VSDQRAAISDQRSAISDQRSAISDQRSAISVRRSACSDRRAAIGDECRVIGVVHALRRACRAGARRPRGTVRADACAPRAMRACMLNDDA
jgi:hypothetical protein